MLYKVLLLENIHSSYINYFSNDCFDIKYIKGSLDNDSLIKEI